MVKFPKNCTLSRNHAQALKNSPRPSALHRPRVDGLWVWGGGTECEEEVRYRAWKKVKEARKWLKTPRNCVARENPTRTPVNNSPFPYGRLHGEANARRK